ncbi:MAG: nickel-dependent lactate racemase, partial [Desulfobacterales bacterium]|nr:nickel-dependent lactate racemase [Desulfobacterales bacterium]
MTSTSQQLTLPWGKEKIELQVPATWTLIHPELNNPPTPSPKSEIEIVEDALASPHGAAPLKERNLTGKRIVVITDDNTRPTPVFKFFSRILDILEGCGANLKDAVLLPGLGIHTAMAREEMEAKVGAEGLSRIQWENHDAFDPEKNAEFGTTSRGTLVSLNHRLKDADMVILLGLIEPHLMAGFGGGLKNVLPGVASAATIGQHHQLLTDPPQDFNRVGMAPEKNNFRLDLEEVAAMVPGEIFCLNVVIDESHNIQAAFAGDGIGAHRAGVDYTRKAQELRLGEPVDGVIVNSFPMDINFKQSMKCVGNSLPALKPNGVVMGFLRADRGLDDIPLPDKMPLPLWLIRAILRLLGPSRVFDFLKRVKKGLNAEEKFLYYYMLQLVREHRLFLHVPTLSDLERERLF